MSCLSPNIYCRWISWPYNFFCNMNLYLWIFNSFHCNTADNRKILITQTCYWQFAVVVKLKKWNLKKDTVDLQIRFSERERERERERETIIYIILHFTMDFFKTSKWYKKPVNDTKIIRTEITLNKSSTLPVTTV